MADASRAAEAVKVALNWSATVDERTAATAYLDTIKYGDVRVLGAVALAILQEDQPLEVRHFGMKLLQHLIRIRWDDLSDAEKKNVGSMVMGMVQSFAKPSEPWSLKSQTAALAAEVARREGPGLWKEMLHTLFNASGISPIHAEMVAMVLRWLPEDVIVHNEDLEGDRRRTLLTGLTQTLPDTLPFLYKLLDSHFSSAMLQMQQSQLEAAKQHAAVVTAVLNALLAYAEWAPVTMFSSYGLVEACGFLLNSTEFRLTSCEIMKQLVSRRKPDDGATDSFNLALSRVFEILSGVSEVYFQRLHSGGLDESSEFAECLCEALVAFGTFNLHSIASDEQKLTLYYKEMLAFLQHPKFSFHAQALPVWQIIVRDSVEHAKQSPKPFGRAVPTEVAAVLLDVAFRRLCKPGKDSHEEIDDDFSSATDYSQYRGRLMGLIRSLACAYPTLAINQVAQHLDATLRLSSTEQQVANLEIIHTMLDAVITGMVQSTAFTQISEPGSIMQGLLQRLLAIEWHSHELVEVHGKIFDAFGPYLKHYPAALPAVIQKLFTLIATVPIALKEGRKPRIQICTSFLRIAKAADSAFLPHMQPIAETMIDLQRKNLLLRSEHILLGEALLVAASVAGAHQQCQVLEWLLGPFRERWIHPEWQQKYLSDSGAFLQLLTEDRNMSERMDKGMWHIYHSVALFEKALRRCSGTPHPMAVHMQWILPPLLQLLRCLHALWSPPVISSLPAFIRNAMAMGSLEQAAILGDGSSRPAVEKPDEKEEEEEMRNFLKGIRDSGYNVLGFASARIKDEFFGYSARAAPLTTSLLENLPSMEFRHIRLMLHLVVVPFIKACPRSEWSTWLGPLVPPLLLHCCTILPASWGSLLNQGAVKTLTLLANTDGTGGLKTELIEERILRELTREVCNLLAVLVSPELNQNTSEQQGMLFFIMGYGDAAASALQLGIQSLHWPDTDVVHKSTAFCAAVTNLATTVSDPRLHELVGRDMFTAVIHSLTCESNASVQSELLGLLRDIYVGLSSQTSLPKQVLMSLPSVAPHEFARFEAAFGKTSSAKEQRQHLKSLLLSVGSEHLKALKSQKSNVMVNVSSVNHDKKKDEIDETGGPIGLATML